MSKLELGSRRIINVYDGSGHDDWIPGTLAWWEEPNYAVFRLDRRAHDGRVHTSIPLPNGRHRLRTLHST